MSNPLYWGFGVILGASQLKKEYEESIAKILAQESPLTDQLIYNERKRFFGKYDKLLDTPSFGPHHLKNPQFAQLVQHELHRFDGELYDLFCYCIMSNHVHILIDTRKQLSSNLNINTFETIDFEPLYNVMKRIKGPTAIYANRLLQRQGKLWQRESFDHYVRSGEELLNIIKFIMEHPKRASLTAFSYLRQREPVN